MIQQSNVLQSTTQKYLEIFDITNDTVIMQDGSCSIVLKTSAINFDLFSEDEQDATIYAYASLLNSLSFPIEIVVRSQRKDVTNYLELLKQQELKAYTPIKKKQIREYRTFVEQLVQERNVLDKKFYIILTYTALELGIASATTVVPTVGFGKKPPAVFDKYAVLEKALTNLQPRADHLIHQCARIGLYAQQLNTQELIQLFYTIYNPEAAEGQKVVDASEYTAPLVQADLHSAVPTPPPSQPASPTQGAPTPIPSTTPQQASIPNTSTQPQAQTIQPASTPAIPPEMPKPISIPSSAPEPNIPPLPSQGVELKPYPTRSPQPSTPPAMAPQPPSQPQVPSNNTPSPLQEESFTLHTDLQPPTPPAMSTNPGATGQ